MAEFIPAYERMIRNEGGYKLHQVAGDKGGQTYAGIARNRWPAWHGWRDIDAGQIPETELVREFYRVNFWQAVRGEDLFDQGVAESLFDFAVNAGVGVAVKLAQIVAGATPDGVLGPRTVAALNQLDGATFKPIYALSKLARYRDIVTRDRTQEKFLLGWVNRTLREAA